jgi:DNA-binding beta-propeller fold protein YncE
MKNNFYFLLGFLMIFSACETESGSDEIYKVYIAYQGADKVGVINGETGEIIREVEVDMTSGTMDNPHFVIIDENHGYWYVTLISSGYVLKFDLYSDEMIDSVLVGNMPALMALDEIHQRLYVSRFMPMMGTGTDSKEVHQIDIETMAVLGAVNIGANSPHGIALSADGETLWVASNQASHFFRIETGRFGENGYQPENFKIASDVQPSYEYNDGYYDPLEVELSIDGSKVFISCSDPAKNEVRVFDAADPNTLVALYPTGTSPWHMAIVPDGSGLYTTNRAMMNPGVSYINLSDNSVSQIESEYFDLPHGIGISGDGSRVFVTSSAMMGDYLHIIDTSTNDVINSIELGNGVTATGLAVMQSMCTDCD